MAVINSIGKVAFPRNSTFQVGKHPRKVGYKEAVVAAGAVIGDQRILAGPFTSDFRISRILANAMPALTSMVVNLGFAKLDSLGNYVQVQANSLTALWSGVSLATAVTTYSDILTGKNAALDNTKTIGQLLNIGPDSEPVGGIYLVMTTTTAQTAGGPLTLDLDIEVDDPTSK